MMMRCGVIDSNTARKQDSKEAEGQPSPALPVRNSLIPSWAFDISRRMSLEPADAARISARIAERRPSVASSLSTDSSAAPPAKNGSKHLKLVTQWLVWPFFDSLICVVGLNFLFIFSCELFWETFNGIGYVRIHEGFLYDLFGVCAAGDYVHTYEGFHCTGPDIGPSTALSTIYAVWAYVGQHDPLLP